jgi:hypothetical protein
MHDHCDRQADGVCQNMALAALDHLLGGAVATCVEIG